MIRKLRCQFVAVCMLLITAILGTVLVSVYFSAQSELHATTHRFLERVLADDTRPGQPWSIELPGSGGESVQLPYFTVQIWDSRTVYVTGGTYAGLEDTGELRAILTDCLRQPEDEGSIDGYDLRYLRRDNGLYVKAAFVDISMETAALRSLMRSYVQIGLAALALLLLVSVALSFWVTKPVERAWRQQQQFFSDASHELKTPLTVILSNAELLEQAELPERESRWRSSIRSEAVQMKQLVEEMLQLSRAEGTPRFAAAADVNLSDTAADCVLAFEPVAYEAGKKLQDTLEEGVFVRGEADKLRQLLSILLDNAIKYGRPGSPIQVTLRKGERSAVLTVQNENAGEPIPPEQLRRLFERFYRADDSRGEQSGFGLGLPIAAAIARQHKASLKVESDSAGTRFRLTIPLKR